MYAYQTSLIKASYKKDEMKETEPKRMPKILMPLREAIKLGMRDKPKR
jgi:hypothetical protein